MPLSFHVLPPSLKTELIDHFKASSPREAVGLILTDGTTLRLRNWSRRPDRFLVGYLTILWNLGWNSLRYGDGISMIYHSHTVTPEPSHTDRSFMAVMASRWPGVHHLIYVPGHQYGIWQYGEPWLDH